MAEPEIPVSANYFLQPGYIVISINPTIISGVLGSCVAISLYDKKRKIGGMNHFKYPYTKEKQHATAIYGNVATLALIRMMIDEGSKIQHLEAQILGGAHNREIASKNIGRENVMLARKILSRERIKVVSEDVGGEKGRKVIFNTHTNEIAVIRVDRLRISDWYPYENEE